MLTHFNNLVMASPTDGASTPTTVSAGCSTEDIDQLMDAWYRERQERIETGLFLDRARDILGQILSEGCVTLASRRKARRLLMAIKAAEDEAPG